MSKVISYTAVLIGFALVFGSISTAEDRFIVNGDGTVTDLKLRVMWAQNDNQSDISWKQAQSWAQFTFADTVTRRYDNWRLPTIKELESLSIGGSGIEGYEADCGHWVKIVPQIRISCILIWTSETALGLPLAFNFNIGDPFTVNLNESSGCRALPVRPIK